MGWATEYIARLRAGETVSFRPHGRSMEPRVRSGQLCTVEPCAGERVEVGDVVLCKVGKAEYLHNVISVDNGRLLIGNNHGRLNGWVTEDQIFGRLVQVED